MTETYPLGHHWPEVVLLYGGLIRQVSLKYYNNYTFFYTQ